MYVQPATSAREEATTPRPTPSVYDSRFDAFATCFSCHTKERYESGGRGFPHRKHLDEIQIGAKCGDCHVGNLGPVGNASGKIQIQIRDLDQTVNGPMSTGLDQRDTARKLREALLLRRLERIAREERDDPFDEVRDE